MVNEQILNGLKFALAKGQTLKQAMMSFYNAGYSKQEIEEAARYLYAEQQKWQAQQQAQQPQAQRPIQQPLQPAKPAIEMQKPLQQIAQQYKPQEAKQIQQTSSQPQAIQTKPEAIASKPEAIQPQQVVSGYAQKPNPVKRKVTFTFVLLIIFLIILIGALAAIFIYRQELMDFFNSLF